MHTSASPLLNALYANEGVRCGMLILFTLEDIYALGCTLCCAPPLYTQIP
jgi:hypothetical protein